MGKLARLIGRSMQRLSGRITPTTSGSRGEQVAVRFLKRSGYRVIEHNWRTPSGEIDILALAPDQKTVVVVEVKSRSIMETDHGDQTLVPEVHVNQNKQRQLVLLACQAVRCFRLTDRPIRFDVVGVDLVKNADPVVRHHVGAFESHV